MLAPVFGFECDVTTRRELVSVRLGCSKLIAASDEERRTLETLEHAYQLARDPWEQVDAREATWAGELEREWTPVVERLLEPAPYARQAQPGAAQLKRLEELGFAGDD